MIPEQRHVLDTNVIVSALFFPDSLPAEAFNKVLDEGQVLLSPSLVEELSDVLSREKFDRYLPPDEREQFLQALVREAAMIAPTETIQGAATPRTTNCWNWP